MPRPRRPRGRRRTTKVFLKPRRPRSLRSSCPSLLAHRLIYFDRLRLGASRGAAAAIRWTEPSHIDAEVADLVVENPLGRVEQARRLCPVAARRLEGVLDEVALKPFDSILQRN